MSLCPLLRLGPPTAAWRWKYWRGGGGCRWMPRFGSGTSSEALRQGTEPMAWWPWCGSSDSGELPGQVSLAPDLPLAWLGGRV